MLKYPSKGVKQEILSDYFRAAKFIALASVGFTENLIEYGPNIVRSELTKRKIERKYGPSILSPTQLGILLVQDPDARTNNCMVRFTISVNNLHQKKQLLADELTDITVTSALAIQLIPEILRKLVE